MDEPKGTCTNGIDPKKLPPGATIRYRQHRPQVVSYRKDDGTGWWLTDGTGLDDDQWQHGEWSVVSLYGDRTARSRPSVLGAKFIDWNRLWEDVGAAVFEEDEQHAKELAGVLRVSSQRLLDMARRLDRAVVDG